MRKGILSSLLVMASSALSAQELTTFNDITQELSQGKSISAVINTKYCTVNDPNEYKIPTQTMVTKPVSVVFTDDLLSFDGTKFAPERDPLPKGGLMQRASFLLNAKGQLNAVIAFYHGETNKQIEAFQNVTIACHLGEGLKVFQA
jgi:hypothetical protein